jgi:hypothetical protein
MLTFSNHYKHQNWFSCVSSDTATYGYGLKELRHVLASSVRLCSMTDHGYSSIPIEIMADSFHEIGYTGLFYLFGDHCRVSETSYDPHKCSAVIQTQH